MHTGNLQEGVENLKHLARLFSPSAFHGDQYSGGCLLGKADLVLWSQLRVQEEALPRVNEYTSPQEVVTDNHLTFLGHSPPEIESTIGRVLDPVESWLKNCPRWERKPLGWQIGPFFSLWGSPGHRTIFGICRAHAKWKFKILFSQTIQNFKIVTTLNQAQSPSKSGVLCDGNKSPIQEATPAWPWHSVKHNTLYESHRIFLCWRSPRPRHHSTGDSASRCIHSHDLWW